MSTLVARLAAQQRGLRKVLAAEFPHVKADAIVEQAVDWNEIVTEAIEALEGPQWQNRGER